MNAMLSKVNGFKTYITGAVTVLSGIGIILANVTGDSGSGSVVDGMQLITSGFAMFTIRHAIK